MRYFTPLLLTSLLALVSLQSVGAQSAPLTEAQARQVLNNIYKGDYRAAFTEKKPELFLKYIPADFQLVQLDGAKFDAAAMRQFVPIQFSNMLRTIEHNVSIEDVDVLPDGTISAVVTLNTLIELRGQGGQPYLVSTTGTYRDDWQSRSGTWFEVRGTQLRNQVTTAPRP